MSDAGTPDLGERPEPKEDPTPDGGPGGPADAVESHEEHTPPATPDQPRSAQIEEENVPDEIQQPEELDEDEKDVDPSDEAPV